MNEWTKVCQVGEIPQRGARVVKSAEGDIALFRTADDEVFALRDRCPHKGGPLSQGLVYDHKVSCPLHGWQMDLATGDAVAPDSGCARRYPVKVENGTVFLAV